MITEFCTYLPSCLQDLTHCPCLCPQDKPPSPPVPPIIIVDPNKNVYGDRACSYKGQIQGFHSGNQTMLVTDTHVWMAYRIICELITRFGPTLLLIILNVAIIRNFNLSVQRKKKLRASRFIQRSASKLMDHRPSQFFAGPTRKKLSSAT